MKDLETIKANKSISIMRETKDGIMGFIKTRTSFVFSWHEGWEHLSVAFKDRTPTWDEMCQYKDIFFEKDECCVQYHPAESEYVNIHEHCLHIWKPLKEKLPTPPKRLVM